MNKKGKQSEEGGGEREGVRERVHCVEGGRENTLVDGECAKRKEIARGER